MKVHELMAALSESDPDGEVRVAVELGDVESVSFHRIQEIDWPGDGQVEIIVYEAHDLYCSPPWLAPALLGEAGT